MNRAFLMLVVALGAFVLPGCHVHLHVGEKHYYNDGQNSGGERSLSDISEELLNVGQTQDQ